MVHISRICDRCRKEFARNEAYAFDGPRKEGTLTGFSFMANRKYLVDIKDLCDECVSDLIDWFYAEQSIDEYIHRRPEGGFDDERSEDAD